MKIGILGTGIVGMSMAARLSELGHEVVVGTRDIAVTLARTETDMIGNPPFSAWHPEHQDVRLDVCAAAAKHGEFIVSAAGGDTVLEVLKAAGSENLAGKVILDIANPLDFAEFPPTLFVNDTDSLAEQIQRGFPDTKVVKALNTMVADLMVHPGALAGGDHTVFISGNDSDAKETVSGVLRDFGWRDIIDLGDISTARGAEMLVPLWIRLVRAFDSVEFNFKVVRPRYPKRMAHPGSA